MTRILSIPTSHVLVPQCVTDHQTCKHVILHTIHISGSTAQTCLTTAVLNSTLGTRNMPVLYGRTWSIPTQTATHPEQVWLTLMQWRGISEARQQRPQVWASCTGSVLSNVGEVNNALLVHCILPCLLTVFHPRVL